MQSPPFPRYLVPPRSKYSPKHHVLKHPQLPFLPQCQRPTCILNHNKARFIGGHSVNDEKFELVKKMRKGVCTVTTGCSYMSSSMKHRMRTKSDTRKRHIVHCNEATQCLPHVPHVRVPKILLKFNGGNFLEWSVCTCLTQIYLMVGVYLIFTT